MTSQITIIPELAAHDDAIEEICALAFGPGRFTRTAFRLRERSNADLSLSFVALENGKLVGSVRQTPINIGESTGLLLGPLVVIPERKSSGIGAALVQKAVSTATLQQYPWILLVGDQPYYGRFGFEKIARGRITLPGPVDPDRLLLCPIDPEVSKTLHGQVRAC